MQTQSFHVELSPHLDSLAPEVQRITVEGSRAQKILSLTYTLEGDWSNFVFPDAAHPVPPTDALWEYSCCELFWRWANAKAYREYNFSASQQWAAYAFSAYRQQKNRPPPAPRNLNWVRNGSLITLQVEIPISADSLQLAFAVILERVSNRNMLYYALCHPAARPDFHHPNNFALTLPECQP
ncbi:MAG: hypothetical protein LBQ75_02865 [Zoogloeaceae bacterium]|nr:hypothetical protein [Zoogloeaceae bacterium]